jgi:hypothetical protein
MKLFLCSHCVPLCVQVHLVFPLILNELENIYHVEISQHYNEQGPFVMEK